MASFHWQGRVLRKLLPWLPLCLGWLLLIRTTGYHRIHVMAQPYVLLQRARSHRPPATTTTPGGCAATSNMGRHSPPRRPAPGGSSYPYPHRAKVAVLQAALQAVKQRTDCDENATLAFDAIPRTAWVDPEFPPALLVQGAQALSVCARNSDAIEVYEHLVLRARSAEQLHQLLSAVAASPSRNAVAQTGATAGLQPQLQLQEMATLAKAARLLLFEYVVVGNAAQFRRLCGEGTESANSTRSRRHDATADHRSTGGDDDHHDDDEALLSLLRLLLRRGFDQCLYMAAFFDVLNAPSNSTAASNHLVDLAAVSGGVGDQLSRWASAPPSTANTEAHKKKQSEHLAVARHLAFTTLLEDLHDELRQSPSRREPGPHASQQLLVSDDYGGWQSPQPLPQRAAFPCNIPRRRADAITAAQFQDEFLLLNRPVILEGLTLLPSSPSATWPAHTDWALEPMLRHFGEEQFLVRRGSTIAANKINKVQEKHQMTLREFVEAHMRTTSSSGGGTAQRGGGNGYYCDGDGQACTSAGSGGDLRADDADPDYDPMYILDNPGARLRTSGAFPDPLAPWFWPTYS